MVVMLVCGAWYVVDQTTRWPLSKGFGYKWMAEDAMVQLQGQVN